jgi:hypothetical protein
MRRLIVVVAPVILICLVGVAAQQRLMSLQGPEGHALIVIPGDYDGLAGGGAWSS